MSYSEEHKYDDIMNLPHYVSKKHPQMPLRDRAAQFSPFAALTGHEAAIEETARLTDERPDLDENRIEILDRKLQRLREKISERPVVTMTYYVPDERKKGGSYVTTTGIVRKIDEHEHRIFMESGEEIHIINLIEVDISEM